MDARYRTEMLIFGIVSAASTLEEMTKILKNLKTLYLSPHFGVAVREARNFLHSKIETLSQDFHLEDKQVSNIFVQEDHQQDQKEYWSEKGVSKVSHANNYNFIPCSFIFLFQHQLYYSEFIPYFLREMDHAELVNSGAKANRFYQPTFMAKFCKNFVLTLPFWTNLMQG